MSMSGRVGRLMGSFMHGIGRKRLPKGDETHLFKTSSSEDFSGIFMDTLKEVVIW